MELVHSVYQTSSEPSARSPSPPSPNGEAVPKGTPIPNGGSASNGGVRDTRDVFHVSFDPDAESLVEVITNAVAVIHNDDPGDLDPLHAAVDVEALDELVASSMGDAEGVDEVRFVYEGLEVVVTGDGDVWLRWE